MQFNSVFTYLSVNSCKNVLINGLSVILLTACNPTPEPTQPYDEGVIVVNNGNFLDNNGSLSFIKRDSKTASLDIFMKENARPLTGSITDYTEQGDKGLILVDNSTAGLDKVEVVNVHTMKSLGTIGSPDIENPRAVVGISATKAYVLCWGVTGNYPNFYINKGYIAVVDLTTNKVLKKIAVQKGAEAIAIVGNEAYIGGVGGDEIIQVIDTQKDEVKSKIINIGSEVSELRVDANQKIWTFVEQYAVRINPISKEVEHAIMISSSSAIKTPSAMTLSLDKRTIYFTYTFFDPSDGYKQKGEVYSFRIADANIATTKPIISRPFSGLGFDTKANVLYAATTPSYKQAGYILRYQPDGKLIDSVKVEIAPNKFFFK